MKRVKNIINKQNPALRAYYANISADPDSPGLSPLNLEVVDAIESYNDDLDVHETLTTLYSQKVLWDGEECKMNNDSDVDSSSSEDS